MLKRFQSLTQPMPNPQEDSSNAKRIGRYHVGEAAIYVPAFPFDKYIPFFSIKNAWSQPSTLPVTGCCGKGVPVVLVCVVYIANDGQEVLEKYTLDTQEQADKMLQMLQAGGVAIKEWKASSL